MGHKNQQVRIGIITDFLEQPYQSDLTRLCINEIIAMGAQPLVLCGNSLVKKHLFMDPGTYIYNYAQAGIDGLVIQSGCLSTHSDNQTVAEFFKKFDIPKVSIASPLPGIPNIEVNNKDLMKLLVSHLVLEHKSKKILFLGKIDKQHEGEKRLQAFLEAREEFGLDQDPRLIIPGVYYGNAEQQANFIFEELGLIPQVHFDSIIAVDAYTLYNLMPELKRRNIQIPRDVLALAIDFALNYPFEQEITAGVQFLDLIAKSAIEKLFGQLDKKKQELITELGHGKLLLGESCGCMSHNIMLAENEIQNITETAFIKLIESIELDINKIDNMAILKKLRSDLSVFKAMIENHNTSENSFYNEKIRDIKIEKGSLILLIKIIELLPSRNDYKRQIDALKYKIFQLDVQESEAYKVLSFFDRRTNDIIRILAVNQENLGSIEKIVKQSTEALAHLNINHVSICIFPTKNTSGFLFKRHGLENQNFPEYIEPKNFTDSFFRYSKPLNTGVLYPLFIDSQIYGILYLDLPIDYWHNTMIIETIRSKLSTSLHNFLLLEEREHHIKELENIQDERLVKEQIRILMTLNKQLNNSVTGPIGNAQTASSFIEKKAEELIDSLRKPQIYKSEIINIASSIASSSELLQANLRKMISSLEKFNSASLFDTNNELLNIPIKEEILNIMRLYDIHLPHKIFILNCPENINATLSRPDFQRLVSIIMGHFIEETNITFFKGSIVIEVSKTEEGILLNFLISPEHEERLGSTREKDALSYYSLIALINLKFHGKIDIISHGVHDDYYIFLPFA